MNLLQRLNDREIPLCLLFNRMNRSRPLSLLLSLISRLGDGPIWLAQIVILPLLFGIDALETLIAMIIISLPTLWLYRWLKQSTGRVRPYAYQANMRHQVVALDQFSFPSGHTMHAVAFTTLIVHLHPSLLWLFVPFSALTAVSRVILGLHYPSDVIAGALLGYLLAQMTLALMGLALL